jgi:hypothetical protein
MAVGLSRMLGIRLPINFDSPYKATSIVDFWRRWHITLSRFLRDYLYIPLGGNRHGTLRRYLNLMATMLLGGLWHGAGWTFIVWGGLHGLYLVINHAWQWMTQRPPPLSGHSPSPVGRWAGRIVTFVAVIVAWVFFRAESLPDALRILRGMAGLGGFDLPDVYRPRLGGLAPLLERFGWHFTPPDALFQGNAEAACLFVLLLIVWFTPNSQEIMRRYRPALYVSLRDAPSGWRGFAWRPTLASALAIAILAVGSVLSLTRGSVFLYFQF